jgi:hypothetical protein
MELVRQERRKRKEKDCFMHQVAFFQVRHDCEGRLLHGQQPLNTQADKNKREEFGQNRGRLASWCRARHLVADSRTKSILSLRR